MRRMLRGEKPAAELRKDCRQVARSLVTRLEEGAEAPEALLETAQRKDEVAQVGAVEGPVDKRIEPGQLVRRGVAHEIGRSIIEKVHHPMAIAHNRLTVAPGDGRCKEAGDFAVMARGEAVRDGNGVVVDELGAVVAVTKPFEQFAQFPVGERDTCRRRDSRRG